MSFLRSPFYTWALILSTCSKYVICVSFSDPHRILWSGGTILTPTLQWGNWGRGKPCNIPTLKEAELGYEPRQFPSRPTLPPTTCSMRQATPSWKEKEAALCLWICVPPGRTLEFQEELSIPLSWLVFIEGFCHPPAGILQNVDFSTWVSLPQGIGMRGEVTTPRTTKAYLINNLQLHNLSP